MPDLRRYDFRLQLDDSDSLYQPTIHRFERKRNSWEFTVSLSAAYGPEALGGLEVVYDFPRAEAKPLAVSKAGQSSRESRASSQVPHLKPALPHRTTVSRETPFPTCD